MRSKQRLIEVCRTVNINVHWAASDEIRSCTDDVINTGKISIPAAYWLRKECVERNPSPHLKELAEQLLYYFEEKPDGQ